jgi:L-seryl-tRNA(Ser) seleniumtransferase
VSGIYARLGVKRRINAAGTLTRLGGSLMDEAVLDAMREAARGSVDIGELQSVASRAIAKATGAEAGLVTSGAAAGLTLAAAACIAGLDVARMSRLPDARGLPNEILMARTHRNAYDHALRAAGAVIVDIGHNDRGTGAGIRGLEAWEIEAAITPATVAFAFSATPESIDELPAIVETCRRHRHPICALSSRPAPISSSSPAGRRSADRRQAASSPDGETSSPRPCSSSSTWMSRRRAGRPRISSTGRRFRSRRITVSDARSRSARKRSWG